METGGQEDGGLLHTLPPDVVVSLCARLGPASIGRLCATCKSLCSALDDENLWHKVLLSAGGPRKSSSPRRAARELQTLANVRWSDEWEDAPSSGESPAAPSATPAAREHYVAVSCAQGKHT